MNNEEKLNKIIELQTKVIEKYKSDLEATSVKKEEKDELDLKIDELTKLLEGASEEIKVKDEQIETLIVDGNGTSSKDILTELDELLKS